MLWSVCMCMSLQRVGMKFEIIEIKKIKLMFEIEWYV